MTAAGVVAVLLLLQLAAWQAAAPVSSATGFSQESAYATLSRLLADGKPHPVGSEENAVVRERIAAEFRAAGYDPQIQAAFRCVPLRDYVRCARVENIVAVHRSGESRDAILATAHYDSVPATVGAADDGASVAILLELARSLALRRTRNDVIFLISDAEEAALIGARVFAGEHPLMHKARVALNFEARGASGPSMMFQTGSRNAGLIALFARTIKRPYATSLMYEIYKMLPNDTDFSVYDSAGLPGLNFAFIGSASLYHSGRDNLASLDRASLQQQGDNAFAMTFSLVDANLDFLESNSEASYFDVFGRALMFWPARLNLPVSLAALFALGGIAAVRRKELTCRAVVAAMFPLTVVPAMLFAFGALLSYPLGSWSGVQVLDHPDPWPGRVGLAAVAMFTAYVVAMYVAPRVNESTLVLATWLVFAALGTIVALVAPGASFMLVWPAIGVSAAALAQLAVRRGQSLLPAAVFGFALMAVFWVPYIVELEPVIGWEASQFKALVFAPPVISLVPILAMGSGRVSALGTAAGVSALVAIIAAGAASRQPAFDQRHPQGLNVIYHDDGTMHPTWSATFAGGPDRAYLDRNAFSQAAETQSMFGVLPTRGYFKVAADQHLTAPILLLGEVRTEHELARVEGVLRSARGGFQLIVASPEGSGIRAIRLGGENILAGARRAPTGPIEVRISGLPKSGTPIEFIWDAAARPSVYLVEQSTLPESSEATALVTSRPANYAPTGRGDAAIVGARFELPSTAARGGERNE